MNRTVFYLFFFLFIPFNIYNQTGAGGWRDHLPYNKAIGLIEANNIIYCATESGIIEYNKSDKSLHKLSKIDGLSELNINAIAYSSEYNTIIIAYKNGNIDLIQNNEIINYPFIKNKIIIGNKTINKIYIKDNYAYLSSGFGIIVFNIEKIEIKDTYQIFAGLEYASIYDVCFVDQYLYAATNFGLFVGNINDNLVDFSKWNKITDFQSYETSIENIEFFNNQIYISQNTSDSTSNLLYYDGTSWNTLLYTYNKQVYNMEVLDNSLVISTSKDILFLNQDNLIKSSITDYGFSKTIRSQRIYIDNNNTYWIADKNFGIVSNVNGSFSSIKPVGPVNNYCYKLKYINETLWVAGGGITDRHHNLYRHAQLHRFFNEKWSNITLWNQRDIISFDIDPKDPDHIFAGTYGNGLLEINDYRLVNDFNVDNKTEYNHTLESIVPGQDYIRIGGVAIDKYNSVWVTNMNANNVVSIYSPDADDNKKWIGLALANVGQVYVGEILITKDNYKWINLLRDAGILIYDDNNTPTDLKDDQYKKIPVFDQNGKTITSEVFAIAEDQKGDIWVGTDMGVYVFYNALNVFSGDHFYASKILIPRNDGTGTGDILLETEAVNCIKIDGANRKWFGTKSSGVYLFSSDGLTQIKHFYTGNSPLLSDYILDIEIDGSTGEVFFSTSEGLISYKGTASDENLQKNLLYAYPNPVRPEYKGPITIAGLIANSNVKITDISGNIVYETRTLGGQAIWDGKTMQGERVKTGVYLIFCTNDYGTETKITKLLVIN